MFQWRPNSVCIQDPSCDALHFDQTRACHSAFAPSFMLSCEAIHIAVQVMHTNKALFCLENVQPSVLANALTLAQN